MSDNRVDGVLAAADAEAVMAAIKTIRDALPFLIDLSPDEKRSLPALGEASRGFVAKALEGARQNPNFLPKSFVLDAAQRDLDLFDALLPISLALTQLQELVDDTVHAAGGEAYNDARLVYQFAKAAPPSFGLDQFVKDLATRFARRTAPAAPPPLRRSRPRRRPPPVRRDRRDGVPDRTIEVANLSVDVADQNVDVLDLDFAIS